jgi:hypothetical protein
MATTFKVGISNAHIREVTENDYFPAIFARVLLNAGKIFW